MWCVSVIDVFSLALYPIYLAENNNSNYYYYYYDDDYYYYYYCMVC